MTESDEVVARRRRLREAARKVFDEYGMDHNRKRKAGVKQMKPAVKPSGCKICGAPIEKTGKPGRPPTKCLKHRS